jgi:L-gulono-1,4-lactone dehydrogenase
MSGLPSLSCVAMDYPTVASVPPLLGANPRGRRDPAGSCTRVASERDIIGAIRDARRGRYGVRAVGSKGSKNQCYLTPDMTLQLGGYDQVLSVQADMVVAQAGITIGTLNAALARHGLALPTVGEWAGATLGGALATGTHGGSGTHGILASSVRAMRIITGDGHAQDLDWRSELFGHAAVSLGMLGVTSTLTLQCVEHFHLAMEVGVRPLEQYLCSHAAANRSNEFYSAVWIPTAHRVITFAANRAPAPSSPGRRTTRFGPKTFVLNAVSRRMALPAFLGRWLAGTTVDEVGPVLSPIAYGPGRLRLLRALGGHWKAVEFAIPLSRAGEAIALLDRFLADRREVFAHPVGLRATPADAFSLSPCYGRDTFWLDIFFRDNERLERELGDLFQRLDARCHWGKHIGLSPGHLRGQYQRWDAFAAARSQLDPGDVFANAFTRRFAL